MENRHDILKRKCAGRSVHRRIFTKPDGRDVMLYGFEKHEESPAAEMLDGGPKQAHMRWHPLRREWAVYASGRQNRTFKPLAADDPLAPTLAGGPATEIPFTAFDIAIFENRFPSFSAGSGAVSGALEGVQTQTARGRCDVVVYTSESTGNLATLSQPRRELLTHAWIDRYAALYKNGAAFVLPFENRGEEVGVTLLHPHGQIYAFPVVPAAQMNAAKSFAEGFDLSKNLAEWRHDFGVADENGVIAFAPPFARFPYEIWIAPLQRRQRLEDMCDTELSGFAHLLGDVTRRYDSFFGRDTPYMLSLHAAPAGDHPNWHFTAQFYPLLRARDKIKYLASVEQATGLFTVDVAPEESARRFRELS
ncbi:MAG: galactose-1-phosphate uridylyltransferase [Pseudomonadota bacterium]